MIGEAVSSLVASSFNSSCLFTPLPCAGSGLSATGEIRQTGREGQEGTPGCYLGAVVEDRRVSFT